MFLVSPTVPGGPARDKLQYEGVLKEVGNKTYSLDMGAIRWFLRATRNQRWSASYFGDTPVFAGTGSTDPQVLPEDRIDLQNLAAQLNTFKYEELIGAEHNLFTTSDQHKKNGRRTYENLYNFISNDVLTRQRKKYKRYDSKRLIPWYNRIF